MSASRQKPKPRTNGVHPNGHSIRLGQFWGEIEFSPGWTVEMVWITPGMAEKWLKLMLSRQRNPKPPSMASLIRDIKAGRWICNGETIIFDEEGNLVDGQHRLLACVQAEVPIMAVVIRGVPTEAYETIDGGSKRTHADALPEGTPNKTAVAGALNLLYRIETGARLDGSYASSNQLIKELFACHPGIERSAAVAKHVSKVFPSTATAAYCHYQLSKINATAADLFFDMLYTGADLSKGDPVHTLREKLIEARGRYLGDRKMLLYFVYTAWNAWRSKKPLSRLLVPKDAFDIPSPI